MRENKHRIFNNFFKKIQNVIKMLKIAPINEKLKLRLKLQLCV